MVTTRITEAFPITSPRAVRKLRNLLARRASQLNRSASPKYTGLRGSSGLLQQSFGLLARRIVRRQVALQVLAQQIPRLLQVASLFDVDAGACEIHRGRAV